jgi:hypothetical protein
MKIKNYACVILIAFLSGCTSGYSITYNTEPKGASVICQGVNKGYSPVTLHYSPDESSKKSAKMETVPCVAVWSSGVRKGFSSTWDLNQFPDGVKQTLQRPNGNGYSQDASFALQLRAVEAAEAAAEAAEDAALQTQINQQQGYKLYNCFTGAGLTTCY